MGPQSFVLFSKSPSYPNIPLCGTKRKMFYLTKDFTKSSASSTDKFFEVSSKRPSCFIESSNGSKGSLDSCITSSSISGKLAFLKQFLTIFGVTSAHVNTRIFLTSMIEIILERFFCHRLCQSFLDYFCSKFCF